MSLQKINIAIAGHTNVGKTTLIRTLMKASVGEVRDAPNVSPREQAYYFDGIQANFIDTPGFQNATAMGMYLDMRDENPNYKIPEKWKDDIIYDEKAMKALEKSNVVLYVASLSSVADDSLKGEIYIIKRKCSKIVGIVNQYEKELRASSATEVENRVQQWKTFFAGESVNSVIVFDAHWDNPAKISQIYDEIVSILDSEQRLQFVEGLKRFKERQLEIRREACNMLADLIKNCAENAVVTISKGDYNHEQKLEDAKEQVARKMNGALAEFVYCVSDLYKVAAEHPTTSKDELLLLMQPKANYAGRIGTGSGAAAIIGGVSAFMGAILGGAIMGFITGGVGALPGALAWAQIAGTVGAAMGSLFVLSDDSDSITIKLNEEQIKTLSVQGIAIIWGLSKNGYGRAKELSSEEGRNIAEKVLLKQASCRQINLASSNKIEILEYCEKIIELLERENT
jgi:GTPase SAR1 family protein